MFSPCMSKYVFILLSHLINSLAGYRNLGWKLISLGLFKALHYFLLVSTFKTSNTVLNPDPLYMTNSFFNLWKFLGCSLYLWCYDIWWWLPSVSVFPHCCVSWVLSNWRLVYLFSGKFSCIISLIIFTYFFPLCSLFLELLLVKSCTSWNELLIFSLFFSYFPSVLLFFFFSTLWEICSTLASILSLEGFWFHLSIINIPFCRL